MRKTGYIFLENFMFWRQLCAHFSIDPPREPESCPQGTKIHLGYAIRHENDENQYVI